MIDERAVFMDEQTDSYFMLDCAGEEYLCRLLDQGQPLSSDSHLLGLLRIADEPARVLRADYPSPSSSLLDDGEPHRARLAHVIKAACLVRRTASCLQTKPFDAVLRCVLSTSGRAAKGEYSREQMIREARNYLSARRLVPVRRNCLLDSLSLLRWLRAKRNGAALIFGIKLNPFAAHCWIQAGDLAVNERVETAAAFTPVRVIQCSEAML